jgi:hypothetical protein
VAPARGASRHGTSWRAPHAIYVAAGALLFFVVWWATARAIAWHQSYAGQIDAWIIARSGRSQTKLLHDGIEWFIWVLRWGIGLTLALSLVADLVANWLAGARAGPVGRPGFHPKRWLSVALLVGLTQLLPWHYVSWRPCADEPRLGAMVRRREADDDGPDPCGWRRAHGQARHTARVTAELKFGPYDCERHMQT